MKKISLLLLPLILTGCDGAKNTLVAENEEEIYTINVASTSYVKGVNLVSYKAETKRLTATTEYATYIYDNCTYCLVYFENKKPTRFAEPTEQHQSITIKYKNYETVSKNAYHFDIKCSIKDDEIVIKDENLYYCYYNYDNFLIIDKKA